MSRVQGSEVRVKVRADLAAHVSGSEFRRPPSASPAPPLTPPPPTPSPPAPHASHAGKKKTSRREEERSER
eukprot:2743379-Rhodomonas_salina.1